ncbi:MAG: TetR/AcrR family transcriptional regulator [Desulfobacterales bacterium]|nr:MAG: TetR/AcrR family transcriptional regulator [Desulfobacterales bacterium]
MGIAERRQREKSRRKKLIQNAALEVFMRKGFSATTMEDIAEKAELSIATIYLYFKSKDELYASLNLLTFQYLHDQVQNVYENRSLTVEEKMLGYRDAMYDAERYNPTILRIIFHFQVNDILPSLDRKLLAKLDQLGQKTMAMIAATYEEGVRQGKFQEGSGMVHAEILWAIFSGLVLWHGNKRRTDSGQDVIRPTLDRAFDIFCRGIQHTA